MLHRKLTRFHFGLLILLGTFLLLVSTPASAQHRYSIKIMKWNTTTQEFDQIRDRSVYFVINNLVIQSSWDDADGNIGVEVGERAGEAWTAYVGPFRWQYYYHNDSVPPSLPPWLGGTQFPVNRRNGTVYISEI